MPLLLAQPHQPSSWFSAPPGKAKRFDGGRPAAQDRKNPFLHFIPSLPLVVATHAATGDRHNPFALRQHCPPRPSPPPPPSRGPAPGGHPTRKRRYVHRRPGQPSRSSPDRPCQPLLRPSAPRLPPVARSRTYPSTIPSPTSWPTSPGTQRLSDRKAHHAPA